MTISIFGAQWNHNHQVTMPLSVHVWRGINGNKQWISWKRCKKIRWFRISSATIQPSLLARFLGNLGLHKWAVDYQNQVWESLTKQYTGIKCRNFWTLSLEYSYISNNNTYIYDIIYIYYIYNIYYTAQVFFCQCPHAKPGLSGAQTTTQTTKALSQNRRLQYSFWGMVLPRYFLEVEQWSNFLDMTFFTHL